MEWLIQILDVVVLPLTAICWFLVWHSEAKHWNDLQKKAITDLHEEIRAARADSAKEHDKICEKLDKIAEILARIDERTANKKE